VVRSAEELEQLEIALVENVQRVDLSPLEQATSIQRLHEQFSLSYEAIGKRLGKATTTISNIARLLNLPESAQKALSEQKITEGHARAVLALKTTDKQRELLDLIIKNGWNVRQAERYVNAQKEGVKDSSRAQERVQTSTPETKNLSKLLGAKVTIRRTAKGGKLEIAFKSDEDLERLMKKIS
jgi:ParB family chromosome partitioning protein